MEIGTTGIGRFEYVSTSQAREQLAARGAPDVTRCGLRDNDPHKSGLRRNMNNSTSMSMWLGLNRAFMTFLSREEQQVFSGATACK